MSSNKIRGLPNNSQAPRQLTFASITQVMSSAFVPQDTPRPVLLAITTRGKPFYFHVTEQGIAGWVPLPDFEAVMKSPEEIKEALEKVEAARAAKEEAEDNTPKIVTGIEANQTMAQIKELERGVK